MPETLLFKMPPLTGNDDGLDSRLELSLGKIRFLLEPRRRDTAAETCLLQLENGARIPVRGSFGELWRQLQEAGWTMPPYAPADAKAQIPPDPGQRRPVREKEALQYLLHNHALFLAYPPPGEKPSGNNRTVALFLNSNDILYWGCAWRDPIGSPGDLQQLYEFCAADPFEGPLRYCCWKNNLQPQKPWQDKLKEDGAWDDFLAGLPANPTDADFDEAAADEEEAEPERL